MIDNLHFAMKDFENFIEIILYLKYKTVFLQIIRNNNIYPETHNIMSEKLVTLAIRTYHRAQILKSVLEEKGIETLIHNLNLENPETAVGVRVRIKEKDLARALKIVEEIESAIEEVSVDKSASKKILVPIDFSDIVDQTIDCAFEFAQRIDAEIVFMYVYFSPAFTISVNSDFSTYNISDSELLRRIITSANADADNLTNLIQRRIKEGLLPKVPFKVILKEGVPEEKVLEYCKKNKPDLVVMGTHGRKIDSELIGSVTAEVIESCNVPVYAVPVQMQLEKVKKVKKLAFLTNFDQKDLIAIDKTIELFMNDEFEIYFIHSSDKSKAWSEVMLGGIKNYFTNHYPKLNANYSLLGDETSPEIIDNFLSKNNIDVLALNSRRRRLFSRLFNPGLAYKMVLNTDTPLFVTHV